MHPEKITCVMDFPTQENNRGTSYGPDPLPQNIVGSFKPVTTFGTPAFGMAGMQSRGSASMAGVLEGRGLRKLAIVLKSSCDSHELFSAHHRQSPKTIQDYGVWGGLREDMLVCSSML